MALWSRSLNFKFLRNLPTPQDAARRHSSAPPSVAPRPTLPPPASSVLDPGEHEPHRGNGHRCRIGHRRRSLCVLIRRGRQRFQGRVLLHQRLRTATVMRGRLLFGTGTIKNQEGARDKSEEVRCRNSGNTQKPGFYRVGIYGYFSYPIPPHHSQCDLGHTQIIPILTHLDPSGICRKSPYPSCTRPSDCIVP